mmetsp:Transcript_28966/g.42563  ORF Transcript_28966/g.42563 Transcript_28966/m.42563 type:complete len:92 (-) Transcript_28966:17-292(-)
MSGKDSTPIPMATATLIGGSDADKLSVSVDNGDDGSSRSITLLSGTHKQSSMPLLDPQMQKLKAQGFPSGLAQAMTKNNAAFPLRIWIIGE